MLLTAHRKLSLLLAALLWAPPSHAHVKWFSKMVDCVSRPLSPTEVIASKWFLFGLMSTTIVIFITSAIDRGVPWSIASLQLKQKQISAFADRWAGWILRLGIFVYFIAVPLYYWKHPVLLTPEVTTNAVWIPYLQAFIAVTALFRKTSVLSAAAITGLFAASVHAAGLFHMLDYVFFLGIIAFLCLNGSRKSKKYLKSLCYLRLTMSLSLMWAGAEKWTYPSWTTHLLMGDLSSVLMGFNPEFFAMMAGFVEFTLAFLLLFGRLSSQIASAVLLLVMLSAIPLVGVVDAIGHSLILAILAVLSVTMNTISFHPERSITSGVNGKLPATFALLAPGVVGLYFFVHGLAYMHWHLGAVEDQISSLALTVMLAIGVVAAKPCFFARPIRAPHKRTRHRRRQAHRARPIAARA